jgi:hypothetical protein
MVDNLTTAQTKYKGEYLDHEHVHRAASLLQALKERAFHQPGLGSHAENRRGQLLRVAHQNALLAAIHQRLQRRHLARLHRHIHRTGYNPNTPLTIATPSK